ncbi:MAG: UTP--glucose-1-phosphate uridylyltransferase GalU [Clostridia bacterium]|nr:UTP--glucose-1-phosphate uridylyltransferase GalU [Clostridia bacterium]
MNKVRKAVIPAAGFGTRFLPATKAIPKEMLPIVDIPTLQYIVEEVVDSGIDEIIIILGKNKKCIEDHFDISVELEQLLIKTGKHEFISRMRDISNMAHIHYVRQKEMNGSAFAVMEAEAFIGNEPFAVIFGDDIMYTKDTADKRTGLKQLIDAYNVTGTTVIGCQTVPKEEAVKYGVVAPGEVKGRYTRIRDIIEKPSIEELPSQLASMGRFVFTPDVFDIIRTLKPRGNGETYLTDAIQVLAKTTGAYAYDMEGLRYDIGDKFGFIQATIEYALRNESIAPKLRNYIKDIAQKI